MLQERLWESLRGVIMKPSLLYAPLMVVALALFYSPAMSHVGAFAAWLHSAFPLLAGGSLTLFTEWLARKDRILFQGSTVAVAPVARAASVLEFLYSKKTYERVFAPAIADIQHEHFEALATGRRAKAVWVLTRGYVGLAGTMWRETPIGRLLNAFSDAMSRIGRP